MTENETVVYNDTCSVCLDDFNDETKNTTLGCGHKFHVHCIIKCLRKSNECPNCRDTDGNPISKTQSSSNFLGFITSDDFSEVSSEPDDYSDFLDSIKKLLRADKKLSDDVREYKKLCKLFHRNSLETQKALDNGWEKAYDDYKKEFKMTTVFQEYKEKKGNYRAETCKLKRRLQRLLEKEMNIPKDANAEFVNKYLEDMFNGDMFYEF